MEKMLLRIYHYFENRRLVFFFIFFAGFATIGFLASRIKLEEDISKILPASARGGSRGATQPDQVFRNSKFIDKLVVTISLKDSNAVQPDSLVAFADAFVQRIEGKLKPYIRKINYRVDDELAMDMYQTILEHLPVYLTQKDYGRIDSLISPGKLRQSLKEDFRLLGSPQGIALKNLIARDPVGISFIALKKIQQLQYDDNFVLYDNVIFTRDDKHVLLFITPAYPPDNTGKNALLLNGIDTAIEQVKQQGFKQVDVSYFGAVAVSEGNARQLRKDSIFTLSITVVFLVLFIGWYFRKKRAPVLILVPVAFGALFSLAVIYLLKGTISVIALGTGSVILGIAVSYSLHVFNHYRHTNDIQQVIKDLSGPLTIGSFTTIGGFLCLEFVQSDMLKDLGLFAAFSLIGASFCSLVFLPQLIGDRDEKNVQRPSGYTWIDKISSWRPERNKFLIALIFLLTLIFAYTANQVSFESDLTRMNFMSRDLQQAEAKLNKINEYALKSVYLVTRGKTLNEALIHNEKLVDSIEALKERSIVKKYSGVSSLMISDSLQKKRIAYWKQYWTAEKKQSLLATLRKEAAELKFRTSAFAGFAELLNKDFQPVGQEAMLALRTNFLDDYITERPDEATVVTLVKTAPEQKQAVYKAFEQNPDVTVVDKQYLTEQFVGIINSDFTRIALMSSILVFVVLWLTYGRIELTLVSFIPMFIAWIWILGIMGMAGIRFNIVNIILSALIFGLGDDYSLFIMDGLLQEYRTGKKNLSSFKSSIVLSAITTLAGLGVLIFAKHPALRSIALISIIGMVCVVLIAQTLIPFFFSALIQNRIKKNFFPWTSLGLAKSIFSFGYFMTGCALLTVAGVILTRLNPFNREKGKLVFHRLISRYSWSVIYIMGNVKKKVINLSGEDFSKPAIIICNHQSFLDTLLTNMLDPKLILLTNEWVWNSPVFGLVVRMADYYPVPQGIENSLDLLADRVRNGYSIVVFPEGTRTSGETLKRFHKGAFFLAEKLALDILPILIHGSAYTMTRGDFLLKDGRISLEFLPRIKPSDTHFGAGYAERTKQIGRYFRAEYARLKTQLEGPAFFREKLIYNYLYKGPVLEWYLRLKLRLEKNYQPFHDLLPSRGKLLDLGCGYGFMSYMLHFTGPEREITGIDYDEEKIEVANHCFSKDGRIRFIASDASAYAFEKYDGIIIADMLHYLQPAAQMALIEKCIGSLNDGGKIVIREGNKDLVKKQRGTAVTEFFSTRLIGFNKTDGKGLSFLSGSQIRELALAHQLNYQEMDDTKYTSNMIFVMSRAHNMHYHENI